ncbi:uncharacterized protein H6S33_000934 [Morchella sextelata]|uniref:uncharacterized protein n=1 Tax=Morchella sextelata TaxID=1174677 RepID=UPI001D0430FF|nr:uncharacterized protein H6S33_000934 [Morchella sextelata]KAH0615298.1 hypothetical protein H6S33_000934 [Morchella sextelata]
MRPVSIFSATLCGVLWVSAGVIVGAAAQDPDATTSAEITTSAPPIPVPTDYKLECLAVFSGQLGTPCQEYCRGNGVEKAAAATEASCVKSQVPTELVTDGMTTAAMATRTIIDPVALTTAIITLANGMPLYVTTVTEHYNSLATKTYTRTRGVSDSAVVTGSPSGTAQGTGGVSSSVIGLIPATVTAGSDGSAATSGATRAASSGGGKSNAGAIAGGVVGGILGLLLIIAAVFFIRRRKNQSTPRDAFSSLEKNRGENSPQSTTPQIPITSYDTPPQPTRGVALEQPYPVESQRSLIGSYPPPPAGVAPVKQQVEVDEDGVSLRSPTPPLGEEDVGRGRDYVPRLPIYHRGSDETPRGPAL